MSEYSVGITRNIHAELKKIRENNDGVTLSGFVIIALDSIVYDNKQVQEIIEIFRENDLWNCCSIRLTDRRLLILF